MPGEQVAEPHPAALLIAIQLFLQGARKLRRRKIGVQEHVFANEARRGRRRGGQPIAKLLEQQRAQHRRWHAMLGYHGKPECDAGMRRERSVGLERADELPAGQVAALHQHIAHPSHGSGREIRDGGRVWRRKTVQSLFHITLDARAKLGDAGAGRHGALEQRGGGAERQRRGRRGALRHR